MNNNLFTTLSLPCYFLCKVSGKCVCVGGGWVVVGKGGVGLKGEVEREECAICKTAGSINLKGGETKFFF